MSIPRTNLKHIVAAFVATVMFSLPFGALALAQTAEESALLTDLATAEADAAIRIDRELQALWSKTGSSSMDLLLRRGRDALEASNTSEAIEHLTALTDHAPDFAEGWHLRAQAFYGADLYGPAVADLERTLALNPNNYNAIFGLGAILETLGDPERAYEAYSRVKAMHPHHEDVDTALRRLESQVSGTSL